MKKIAVYEWLGWGGFVIDKLFPESQRIEAHWTQTSDDVLSLLNSDVEYFITHINMSLTSNIPSDRNTLIEKIESRGIKVLNRNLSDITKRTLQNTLKEAGLPTVSVNLDLCNDDDLLIVKSNFNCGGGMERRLKSKDKEMLGISDFNKKNIPSSWEYKVIRKNELDEDTINNSMLHIERFITNKMGRMWRVQIVGDRMILVEAVVPGDVKKTRNSTKKYRHFEKLGETKGKISAFGGAYMDKLFAHIENFVNYARIDFCSMDIMEDEVGEYYIVDINTTPHWGHKAVPEFLEHMKGFKFLEHN